MRRSIDWRIATVSSLLLASRGQAKEGHHHFQKAMLAHDFSEYSCQNIFQHTDDWEGDNVLRCAYAQTCNEGDGILFATRVFCQDMHVNQEDEQAAEDATTATTSTSSTSSSSSSPMQEFLILAAPLALVLIIMFRVLGSTAEEFFSPGLEMLSLELGLPERFAGVTLLALGNGAPDVASTVNAILNDRKTGYRMALGELTGTAMVLSTVVVGAVTFVSPAGGIACRGALIRDVVMFIATMAVVYLAFSDGTITLNEIHAFLVLYIVYVLVVLTADLYHKRKEISSSLRAAWNSRSSSPEQGQEKGEAGEATGLLRNLGRRNKAPARRRPSYDAVVEALSNYDGGETGDSPSAEPAAPTTTVNRAADEPLMVFHPHHGGMVDLKRSERFQHASQVPECWNQAWALAWVELKEHGVRLWKETYESDQYNIVEKFLMTCELPFMILRMLTIPVPCDGYYCRPVVAISITLCPFWIWYYAINQFDIDITDNPPGIVSLVFAVPFLLGLAVVRWAPCGGVPPRLGVAVPITLVGFAISATWLDLIADRLVDVLSFFGIMLRIPSSIMGLTVLAWGNSSQDLIANMTVARKGLSTMAITASFAGPVFNILVGLGIGLLLLYGTDDEDSLPGEPIPVELNNPLRLGFLFSVITGVLVIISGAVLGKGFLPKEFGYVAVLMYFAYVGTSLTL